MGWGGDGEASTADLELRGVEGGVNRSSFEGERGKDRPLLEDLDDREDREGAFEGIGIEEAVRGGDDDS
jgi:hypothetical protein